MRSVVIPPAVVLGFLGCAATPASAEGNGMWRGAMTGILQCAGTS
jgi:hypothetical protein